MTTRIVKEDVKRVNFAVADETKDSTFQTVELHEMCMYAEVAEEYYASCRFEIESGLKKQIVREFGRKLFKIPGASGFYGTARQRVHMPRLGCAKMVVGSKAFRRRLLRLISDNALCHIYVSKRFMQVTKDFRSYVLNFYGGRVVFHTESWMPDDHILFAYEERQLQAMRSEPVMESSYNAWRNVYEYRFYLRCNAVCLGDTMLAYGFKYPESLWTSVKRFILGR